MRLLLGKHRGMIAMMVARVRAARIMNKMSKYQIEPHYEIEKGCRCLSCWEPTGKWVVTHDDDMKFEMLFDTEEQAKEWVAQNDRT
jgi:hypothetical protein